MLSISVPDSADADQNVTLGGLEYKFTTRYNTRDQRWRLSISLQGAPIISGLKVMENQDLLNGYLLANFSHGSLYCARIRQDDQQVGRNNFGIGKAYELIYLTTKERESL